MAKRLKNNLLQRQKIQTRYFYRINGYVFVVSVDYLQKDAKIRNPFVINSDKDKFFDGSITAIKSLLSVVHNLRATLFIDCFDLSDFYEGKCLVTFSDIVKFLK